MTSNGQSTRRRPKPPSRRDQTAAWWPLVREMFVCGLGAWMLIWQTAIAAAVNPAIVTAGVSLVMTPLVGLLQRKARREAEDDA